MSNSTHWDNQLGCISGEITKMYTCIDNVANNPSCCSHYVTNMPRTSTVMSLVLLLIFKLKGLMRLSVSLVAATMTEVS